MEFRRILHTVYRDNWTLCQTERVRVSSCDGDFTFPVMGTCNLSIGLIRYSMKCNDDEISLLLFAIDICIITELSKNEVYLKCCS